MIRGLSVADFRLFSTINGLPGSKPELVIEIEFGLGGNGGGGVVEELGASIESEAGRPTFLGLFSRSSGLFGLLCLIFGAISSIGIRTSAD